MLHIYKQVLDNNSQLAFMSWIQYSCGKFTFFSETKVVFPRYKLYTSTLLHNKVIKEKKEQISWSFT